MEHFYRDFFIPLGYSDLYNRHINPCFQLLLSLDTKTDLRGFEKLMARFRNFT